MSRTPRCQTQGRYVHKMIVVKVGGPLGGLLEAVYQPHNVEADIEIEVPVNLI
jgi:hypothetical protein